MKPTYDQAMRTEIRKRMSPPNRASVAEIARATAPASPARPSTALLSGAIGSYKADGSGHGILRSNKDLILAIGYYTWEQIPDQSLLIPKEAP